MDQAQHRFFGRERIIRDMIAGLLGPQPGSFSLVGSKLVGKSHLLEHLAAPDGPLLGEDAASLRPYAFQDAGRILVLSSDCNWQDAQEDFLGYLRSRLIHYVREVERIQLDWHNLDEQSGPGRQIWYVTRQLNQRGYRLILLMDNFDSVFENQLLSADTVDELRPLTLELALVVATEQPLHDLDRELAASPLFNVMTQLFIGLLEPDAAAHWLNFYAHEYPGLASMRSELMVLTGNHPFLLGRIDDILAELQYMLPPGQALTPDFLPLIRLRLAEHGRLLFVTHWRVFQNPPRRMEGRPLQSLLDRLLAGPLPSTEVSREQFPILNWLINQAVVTFDPAGYRFFSPLFAEFLVNRPVNGSFGAPAVTSAPPATTRQDYEAPIFEQLTKTEGALLRYFQAHRHKVIPPEELLLHVWKRPDASPRRVQEAIRRLRLQLQEASPPVGVIENEHGRGYRFVPADS